MFLEYYLLLLVNIACCLCLGKQYVFHSYSALADLMCSADKVQFSTTSVGAISCVKDCALSPDCHAAIFYHGNKTCFGLSTECPFDVTIPLSGAVFYKPTVPGCVKPFPLVDTVADSQLSSTSEWSATFAPHRARLNDSTYWGSQANPVVGEYIQVDFMSLRVATAVKTQGAGGTYTFWVTSYTMSTSIDCVTFCAVLDIDGDEQVFPGNTDPTSLVTNNLEQSVLARCLRINPRTWNGHIGMRFEVMGCIA